jgi:hypothetical protein
MSSERGPSWWSVVLTIVSLAASAGAVIGTSALPAQASEPDGGARAEATATRTTSGARSRPAVNVILRAPKVTSDQAPTTVKVVVRSKAKHRAGIVVLKTQGRILTRGKVSHARSSRVKLTMPALAPGQHRLRAIYKGKGAPARHRSEMVTVETVPGCAGDPSACGFPDAGTTGPRRGVKLRNVPGDVTSGPGWHYDSRGWIEVDGDGAVVSGIRAKVGINVEADHVVIEDVHLTVGGEDFGVAVRRSSDVTVRFSKITAPSASGPQRLMVGVKDIYGDSSGIVVARNDISRTATGVQLDHGLVESNYIHDLGYNSGDHVNGTTSNGGSRLLVLRGNTIFNPHDQTDAISLFQDFGGQANRQIVGNLLAGGGYTIYAGAGDTATSGIVVRDNRIARIFFRKGGYYGPAAYYEAGPGNAWSGNVWDDSGRPIPAP